MTRLWRCMPMGKEFKIDIFIWRVMNNSDARFYVSCRYDRSRLAYLFNLCHGTAARNYFLCRYSNVFPDSREPGNNRTGFCGLLIYAGI